MDFALKTLYPNQEKLYKESCQRLNDYAQVYCSICRRKNTLPQPAIIKFPIVEENDPTTANVPHIMCKDCIYTFKTDLSAKMKNGQVPQNAKEVPLKCAVCLKNHKVVFKIMKPFLKGDDGNCCNIL